VTGHSWSVTCVRLAVVLVTFLECRPFERYWKRTPEPDTCTRAYAQLLVQTTGRVALGVVILMIAFPLTRVMLQAEVRVTGGNTSHKLHGSSSDTSIGDIDLSLGDVNLHEPCTKIINLCGCRCFTHDPKFTDLDPRESPHLRALCQGAFYLHTNDIPRYAVKIEDFLTSKDSKDSK
ncbi:hypothetical protein PG990_009068, partial [Apiospora arundinis]